MFLKLKQMLLNRSELDELVSSVNPGFVPESQSLPAISAFIVSESITDALDDSLALSAQNWQVNVIAKTAQKANAIAIEVVAALHKQSADGISRAIVTDRRDDPDISGISRVIIETTIYKG